MSTYVLVHGGCVGGWVWERVAPLLGAKGHRVVTPDLPGHGADRTPVGRVTFDGCVDRVVASLDAAPEPVILVGHSSGGMVVTQAAEHRPDAVARLVYLAAYLPGDGQSLFDLGQTDPDGLVLPNLVVSPDGASARIRPEAVREALFADCAEADLAGFVARTADESLTVATTPVKTTPQRYGRVPTAYLECLRDRAISPAAQRRMHTAAGCDPVLALDTGHMPMYAAPDLLADRLTALA